MKTRDASLATTETTYDRLAELAVRWNSLGHHDQRLFLKRLVSRVTVASEHVEIHVHPDAIVDVGRQGDDGFLDRSPDLQNQTKPLVLTVPACLARRGRELKLMLGGEEAEDNEPDRDLVAAVARAHHWLDLLVTSKVGSIRDLARNEKKLERHIGQHPRLAFLASDIVEAILDGRQLGSLTVRQLIRTDPPLEWGEQRRLLGFTA